MIHFNIAGSVPAGSTITSVTLRLWLAKTGDTQPRTISLYRATQTWGEGTSYLNGGYGSPSTTNDATWLHRFHSLQSWTTAGGAFVATASGSASVGSAANVQQWYSWSSTGMKNDVQGWLNSPSTNFGWVLISSGEGTNQTARRFTSREAVDDGGNHFPELIINYTAPSSLSSAAPVQPKEATVTGLRLLGERDLDGDGKPDLLLRDDQRGVLLAGQRTSTGLETRELVLGRSSMDPLAVASPTSPVSPASATFTAEAAVTAPAQPVRLAP